MEIEDEVDGMFGVVERTERFCENYSEYKRHKCLTDDRSLPHLDTYTRIIHPRHF